MANGHWPRQARVSRAFYQRGEKTDALDRGIMLYWTLGTACGTPALDYNPAQRRKLNLDGVLLMGVALLTSSSRM